MIVFAITSKMFHQCGGGRLDNVNYNLNHIKVSHLLQYTYKIMSLVAGLNMILSNVHPCVAENPTCRNDFMV